MNNFVEKALLAAPQAATRSNDKVLILLLEEAKAEVSHYNEKLNNAYAKIDQMRATLEPFAKAANDFDDFTNKQPDGWNIYSGGNSSYNYISVRHLRRAREVWEKEPLDD